MRKLIFLCRRRADLTHERYERLLLDGHVPLALRHHPTMRRYVVNVVDASPPGWDPLDSVGELSFDTLDDFRERLYDSPEGERVIARDVQGFMGGADAYETTEHVQRAGAPRALGVRAPGAKLVGPLVRRDGMSHEAFVAHWLEEHVPLALRHHPGLTRYVTNVVDARLSDSGPPLDGIAELHFAGGRPSSLFDSAAGEQAIRDDMRRFIGRTAGYWVSEYAQKLPP